MADKDWKTKLQEALDGLGDRLRDVLGTIEELFGPQQELVPVPVPPSGDRRRRPRR